jgi:hypothetical protein
MLHTHWVVRSEKRDRQIENEKRDRAAEKKDLEQGRGFPPPS